MASGAEESEPFYDPTDCVDRYAYLSLIRPTTPVSHSDAVGIQLLPESNNLPGQRYLELLDPLVEEETIGPIGSLEGCKARRELSLLGSIVKMVSWKCVSQSRLLGDDLLRGDEFEGSEQASKQARRGPGQAA